MGLLSLCVQCELANFTAKGDSIISMIKMENVHRPLLYGSYDVVGYQSAYFVMICFRTLVNISRGNTKVIVFL